MSIDEKVPARRTSTTMVVVVLLCVAAFAYSRGWFNWSSSTNEVDSNEVSTEQRIDPENTTGEAPPLTQQTNESTAAPTE